MCQNELVENLAIIADPPKIIESVLHPSHKTLGVMRKIVKQSCILGCSDPLIQRNFIAFLAEQRVQNRRVFFHRRRDVFAHSREELCGSTPQPGRAVNLIDEFHADIARRHSCSFTQFHQIAHHHGVRCATCLDANNVEFKEVPVGVCGVVGTLDACSCFFA